MWADPQLVKVIPRDIGVDLVVVFVNEDIGQKLEKTYTVDFPNPPADWLAQRVAETLVVLNSVNVFAKLFQPGPVPPFDLPQPNPARDAYFTKMRVLGTLNAPGMASVTAADADRSALLKDLENGYKAEYFS